MELGLEYYYSIRLHVQPTENASGSNAKLINSDLLCLCKNAKGDVLFEWALDTLENRIYLMRELFDHWVQNE